MDKPPNNKKENLDEDGLTPEKRTEWNARKSEYDEEIISPENRREAGPEIAELETLLTVFEQKHNLQALHEIHELQANDAPNHPIREPARLDLYPIVKLLNILKEETDISSELWQELRLRHKKLDRAVGAINKGIVDHNR